MDDLYIDCLKRINTSWRQISINATTICERYFNVSNIFEFFKSQL